MIIYTLIEVTILAKILSLKEKQNKTRNIHSRIFAFTFVRVKIRV